MPLDDIPDGAVDQPSVGSSPAGEHPDDATPQQAPAPQPVDQDTPPSDRTDRPSKRGPIPLDRHEAILRRTREGYEQKLQALAWANGLNPDEVREAVQLHQMYRTSPRQLYDHLHGHFQRGQLPPPDLRAEDGTLMYSQERTVAVAQAVARQAVEEAIAGIEQRIGPIEQWSSKNQAIADADAQIEAMQAAPGFSENIDAITDAIAEANRTGRRLSLQEAYIQVVAPKLAQNRDTLTAEVRKAVLAEINGTADRARGSVNPARSGQTTHQNAADRDWADLLREEAAAVGRK